LPASHHRPVTLGAEGIATFGERELGSISLRADAVEFRSRQLVGRPLYTP